MKKIGIWIDKEKAHIVTVKSNKDTMKTIHSEVENYHVKGGSRSKTPWGPHQVVKDSTYMEREKHQLKKYFREIATTIADADSIVIYGPAETNLKLEKELKENFKDIAKKVLKVEKADSMTTNQVKALIRDFYNN
jgi:tRNA uridine 5-carbamoylmethylation protein Kti12